MEMTRKQFLKTVAGAAACAVIPLSFTQAACYAEETIRSIARRPNSLKCIFSNN